MPINATRFLHGQQELPGGPAHSFLGEVERPLDSRNGERAGVAAHGLQECLDCIAFGRFACEIRHVEGKKVACRNKPIDRFQTNVVGIDVVGSRESKRSYRGVGLGPNVIGFAFNHRMLAIGFVPNRVNVDTRLTSIQDGPELGLPLVSEPIAGAESIFLDFHD